MDEDEFSAHILTYGGEYIVEVSAAFPRSSRVLLSSH